MTAEKLFRKLAAELNAEDPPVVECTMMNERCLRVGLGLLREGIEFVG